MTHLVNIEEELMQTPFIMRGCMESFYQGQFFIEVCILYLINYNEPLQLLILHL